MVTSNVRLHDLLEVCVMLFQVVGVASLFLSRLLVNGRWIELTRLAFIVAMVGLGICGAWCGQNDSEFGLFAGGTMTLLLIGMTMGAGQEVEKAPTAGRRLRGKAA